MTNKMGAIIAEIENRLKQAGIRVVIRYPEHYGKIGNMYPLAIVKEGNQNYIATSGNRYEYTMDVTVVIVGSYTQNRMAQMQELQVKVFNELFPDATFGGTAMNVNPVSVNTGEIIKGSDIYGYAGFTETTSFREINIKFTVQDARR